MRKTLQDFCLENGLEDLLQEWDWERNKPLTPSDVTYGSKRRVWWRCEKGHAWETQVQCRAGFHRSGCPVCAGRRIVKDKNDLAHTNPELAAQWHPTRNGELTPEQVTAGTHRKVWWRCGKGHEWQAEIKSRATGCGCPVCAGKVTRSGENDLATRCPELAAQWHPTRNGDLTPEQVTTGIRKKIWWRCQKGHEWQATVSSRVAGCGCPVCTGRTVRPGENDLQTLNPDVAAQWHPWKNGNLTPQAVTPHSNRSVWWRCGKGHEWKAEVNGRTGRGKGCPYCAGRMVWAGFNDLATLEPRIAAQWHPTLNGELTPEQVTTGSCRKVWWQCAEGHAWKAVIHSRTAPYHCGCPVCAGRVRIPRTEQYERMRSRTRLQTASESPAERKLGAL